MDLKLVEGMSFDAMAEALTRGMPGREVKLLKNPLLKFQYVQVRKSAFIGAWVRVDEKKGAVRLIGCIPSAFARAMFGGLIVLLALRSSQKEFVAEVGRALKAAFNTTEM